MTAVKKEYAPSLGTAFGDERFGKGSITLEVTAETLDTAMKSLQVGSKIVFKFNKTTKFGNPCYFVDILPPYEGKKKTPAVKAVPTSALD